MHFASIPSSFLVSPLPHPCEHSTHTQIGNTQHHRVLSMGPEASGTRGCVRVHHTSIVAKRDGRCESLSTRVASLSASCVI